jgi:cell division protease FtsH
VTKLLDENIDILKAVALELLDRETIVLEDLDRMIKEHEVQKAAAAGAQESRPAGEAAQQ